MNFSRSQLIIIGIGAFILLSIILIVLFGKPRNTVEKADLTFWGVEDASYFAEAIGAFEGKYRGLTINYRKVSETNYENQLVDALAAGTGPDVFMFGSNWLTRHGNKVSPAPTEKLSINRFNDMFPQVAAEDFTADNQIYAVPLYIDTLVLYYNRDIFDRLAISLPPRTWDEFKGFVVIRKASASIGGYAPLVTRAADIMNALLMQSGADLDLKNKSFVRLAGDAGNKALGFYLQFIAPKEDTITGFAGERTAMILGYHSDKAAIKIKNPFLNIGMASLPQFYAESPVVPAHYYGLAASIKSAHQNSAWDFINYMTTDTEVADSLVLKGNHPPALRNLIQKYSDDSDLGIFARQALIARSWFMPDDREVTNIFNNMIRSAISAKATSGALKSAEEQINELIVNQ